MCREEALASVGLAGLAGLVGLGGWLALSPDQPPVTTAPVARGEPDSTEPNQASLASQITRNIPNRNVRVILPGPVPIRSASEAASAKTASSMIASARAEATSNVISSAEDPSAPAETLSSATLAAKASRQGEAAKRCDSACGKYRSFRASDCTYQPYRSPRKACETTPTQPQGSEAFAFVPTNRSNCDVQWCSWQYRSFDSASCTYQPYGGGPRKRCEPDVRR
jgi:hypothetical protein